MFGKFLNISGGSRIKNGVFDRRGFTLIELMTVSSIIIIMSVYVAANYHQGNRELGLGLAAGELAQNLRRVQEWGYSAHQIGGVSYTGYGIDLVADEAVYIIYTDDDASGRYTDSGDTVRETIALENDIEIGEIKPCGPDDSCAEVSSLSVNFIPPDPGTMISDSSGNKYDEATISLHLKDDSRTRYVAINRAGLIYAK